MKRGFYMTTEIARQLAALQRIAKFSASLRGHQLADWQTGEDFAQASCIQCGAALRVYFPALHPEMDGPALKRACRSRAAAGRAA
jgi:hypothetical protein